MFTEQPETHLLMKLGYALQYTSWSTFCSTHSDLLSVYQIVTKEVLSSVPISLGKLLKVLKIKYGLPLHLTERFINFISTIETKDIIFEEEPSTGVRQPLIRLRTDKINKSPEGAYCVFVPRKKDKWYVTNIENMVRLHPKDRDLFASFINDTLNERQDWNLASGTIAKEDFRKVRPQITGGVENESREFMEFQRSSSYSNTISAEALLSRDFSVSQEQLSNTLRRTGKTDSEIKDVMNNLANHKNVECFKNSFTNGVTYRKKY